MTDIAAAHEAARAAAKAHEARTRAAGNDRAADQWSAAAGEWAAAARADRKGDHAASERHGTRAARNEARAIDAE